MATTLTKIAKCEIPLYPNGTNPNEILILGLVLQIPYYDARYRTAEAGPTLGHYWKNGHEIENPDDYVEEVVKFLYSSN